MPGQAGGHGRAQKREREAGSESPGRRRGSCGFFLRALYADHVGAIFAGQVHGGLFRVEGKPAGGQDRFGYGEVGRPDDPAGALHFAAQANTRFGHADGDVTDGMDFLGDLGFADAAREVRGAHAGGGEGAGARQTDQSRRVDWHGMGAPIGDTPEGDGEAVAGAELRGGCGDGKLRIGSAAGAARAVACGTRGKRAQGGEADGAYTG